MTTVFGRFARFSAILGLIVVATAFSATRAQAQAQFSASLSSGIASKIGHVELLGDVTFTVVSGTTVPGQIGLDISPIPFADVSGLTISGTGGLAGAALSALNEEAGFVQVSVDPNADAGDSITIRGLRVAVTSFSIVTLPASVNITGNSLVAGQETLNLIQETQDSLYVDATTDATFAYDDLGFQVDDFGDFTIGEGFPDAFSSAVGPLGRTVVTEITFRVHALPNTQVLFPAVIESLTSGATLTAESGFAEIVTDVSPSSDVTFIYDDGDTSQTVIDIFRFSPVQGPTGVPGSGTGYLQVYIGPIGAAVPNDEFPSTDVPRYELQLLPELAVAQPQTRTFIFPSQVGADSQEVAVSNTTTGAALLTFTAIDDTGAVLTGDEIVNPSMFNLLSQQTARFEIGEMFGAGASTANVATIRLDTLNDRTAATTIGRTDAGAFSSHFQSAINLGLYLFERSGAAEMPVLSLVNAGAAVTATFLLRDPAGTTIAQFELPVAEGAAVRQPLDTLFDVDPNEVPLSGYVYVRAPGSSFRGEMLSNGGSVPFAAPGLFPNRRSRITFPFFAVGGGYTTRIHVIQAEFETTAQVEFSAFTPAGLPLGSTLRTIVPRGKLTFDMSEIVVGGDLPAVGYVVMDVDKMSTNPFASTPLVGAIIDVTTDSFVSVAPLINDPIEEFFFTPSASTNQEYTGLALLNNGIQIAQVLVSIYASNGLELGSATVSLPPGTSLVRLVRELVPTAAGHEEGLIEVSASTDDVQGVAFRGTLDLSGLIFLRAGSAP
jgi:hypothetical protein